MRSHLKGSARHRLLLLQVQVLLGRGVRVDNLPLAYLCVLLVYDPFIHTFVSLGHYLGFDRRRLRTFPGTILGRTGRKEGAGSEVRATAQHFVGL